MFSEKCANEKDLARLDSLNFQIVQSVHFVCVIITFLSTYSAIKTVQKKSIFQVSTKIVLFQNLFSANLHQIFAGITAAERLYTAFFHRNQTCIPWRSEADCVLFLEILMSAISGMIYGQTGLLIERALATFMKNYEKKKSILIGSLISFIVLLVSGATGRIIIWDDPLNGKTLWRNTIPSKSGERFTLFFSFCTFISLFNLIMSIFIRKYNQRLEYSISFVVGPRFRKREVIDSTSTILFLTLVQFIFMFIYSFGLFFMKKIQDIITYEQYFFWVVWCYTTPFSAALLPTLLIYRIRSSRINRVMIIKMFTSTKQSQEDHIKQMKNIWN